MLEAAASQSQAFHLHVAYSRPEQADVVGRDYHHACRVDVDLLRNTLPHGRHQFYICGPSAMMESLVPALAQWGVPSEDIHFEAFGPASVRLPGVGPAKGLAAVSAPAEIRFQRSARSLVWDGSHANLLDFAEQHGIRVDSGCRSGCCGSCVTGVRSGTVVYDNPPDFDLAAGKCLLCVGRPAGALVLEA